MDDNQPVHIMHRWKDFFVQIAAIAIGLLLAFGLDRIVGYFHERHQLNQARRELSAEIEENQRTWEKNVVEVRRIEKELKADLNIIQALQSRSPPTDTLNYSNNFFAIKDGSWQAVRQNGALSLMPSDELQNYAWFHGILASIMDAMHAVEPALNICEAIADRAALDRLTPRDLDDLASKTSEAQGRLTSLNMFLRIEGQGLDQFHRTKESQRHSLTSR